MSHAVKERIIDLMEKTDNTSILTDMGGPDCLKFLFFLRSKKTEML